jgi:hypothetical protein
MGNLVSQLVNSSNKTFIAFLKRESDGALFDYENLVFIPNQKLHLTLDSSSRAKFRIPYVEQSPGSYRFSIDCSAFSNGYYTIDSRELLADTEFPSIDLSTVTVNSGSVVEGTLDISIEFAARKPLFVFIKRDYDNFYYTTTDEFKRFDILGDSEDFRQNFRIPFIELEPKKYSITRSLNSFLDGTYTITVYRLVDGIEVRSGLPFTMHVLNNKQDRGVLYNKIQVNHDTPFNDNLRYVKPNGDPVASANVYIFKESEYVADKLDNAIGFTTTDPSGRWVAPIPVDAGYSYVVIFFLKNKYGPDKVTITL